MSNYCFLSLGVVAWAISADTASQGVVISSLRRSDVSIYITPALCLLSAQKKIKINKSFVNR